MVGRCNNVGCVKFNRPRQAWNTFQQGNSGEMQRGELAEGADVGTHSSEYESKRQMSSLAAKSIGLKSQRERSP